MFPLRRNSNCSRCYHKLAVERPTHKRIVQRITDYYLGSRDFNGYPVGLLREDFGMTLDEIRSLLGVLVRRGRITLVMPETDVNPHIKRVSELPKQRQLELLPKTDLARTCAYPSRSYLNRHVDRAEYRKRPFALQLALGHPQLEHKAFDLSVLEFYRNDPRYYYRTDDISGSIRVRQKYARRLRKGARILLETFGFAYDRKLNRVVGVLLRYLAGLSYEHQQIWCTKMLHGRHHLHPDYFRSAVIGEWHEGIFIFQAFIEELRIINVMCRLIGRPPLFKEDFHDRERPKRFGFLIRPTLAEFSEFVHLLDKMMSDNVDKSFFGGEVVPEIEYRRKDGRIEVRPRGTIQMLDEWLSLNFRAPNRAPIDEMINTFKSVRKLRHKPAHTVSEDVFDQKYFKEQRELMIPGYQAVRTLRLVLASDPKAQGCAVPSVLVKGRIWTY